MLDVIWSFRHAKLSLYQQYEATDTSQISESMGGDAGSR